MLLKGKDLLINMNLEEINLKIIIIIIDYYLERDLLKLF